MRYAMALKFIQISRGGMALMFIQLTGGNLTFSKKFTLPLFMALNLTSILSPPAYFLPGKPSNPK